jgi:hypothetical protein
LCERPVAIQAKDFGIYAEMMGFQTKLSACRRSAPSIAAMLSLLLGAATDAASWERFPTATDAAVNQVCRG